ncbi:YlzJ-like family protein [Cytobacillus gottheilii]|uniref:YlzJ-like family protein n=1 Tax=Cytobacillus gottheilii TaxID=859144 RepID=A0ABX8FH52_9BACI|nr:YlzJ-like family protein [Cytobacillus gottheilii]QVY63348.1 YlzJ-like family protein [Cytobacillus gottheilii]
MILYTMMPEELIFPLDSSTYNTQKVVTHNGIPLLVEKLEGPECRVLRVMSSDPNHYMNDAYMPGTKITLT